MVSVRQRLADFFVRYAIVEADRQGVTGPYLAFSFHYNTYFMGLRPYIFFYFFSASIVFIRQNLTFTDVRF